VPHQCAALWWHPCCPVLEEVPVEALRVGVIVAAWGGHELDVIVEEHCRVVPANVTFVMLCKRCYFVLHNMWLPGVVMNLTYSSRNTAGSYLQR
jgi:hypothetical protein